LRPKPLGLDPTARRAEASRRGVVPFLLVRGLKGRTETPMPFGMEFGSKREVCGSAGDRRIAGGCVCKVVRRSARWDAGLCGALYYDHASGVQGNPSSSFSDS
jgi:hypothetical protein